MRVRLPKYSPYRDSYDTGFMTGLADKYERRTRWTRMRLANVRRLVDPRPGDKILDLGCAAGSIAHFLSTFGCETVGVDAAPAAVAEARKLYPELTFELADGADLPFANGSFDKIVAVDLTEHLDDGTLDAMFGECFRILRPGGTLSIHTPNPKHLIERLKKREFLLAQNPTHIGLRSRGDLEERLRRSRFEIDWSAWRRSFIPVFRTFELILGQFTEVLRYRICIRARKPEASAG